MNVTIFNRNYWVRRFDVQQIIRGYVASGYRDFVANLHVHPSGNNQQEANPEGERTTGRLEGHGTDVLVTADESADHKGDLLWYKGRWYECINAQEYDHTVLCHYNYTFLRVPTDGAYSPDVLDPPAEDPAGLKPGTGTFTPDEESRLALVKILADSGLELDADGYLSVTAETREEIRERLGGD